VCLHCVILCCLQGVLQWQAVEAAVRSGCHSVTGILAHISRQASTSTQQQQQQQQQRQRRQPKQQMPDLVTREHLARSLKAWCDEGLLVKPYRGWYDLPG
jgi:hypothetical protein